LYYHFPNHIHNKIANTGNLTHHHFGDNHATSEFLLIDSTDPQINFIKMSGEEFEKLNHYRPKFTSFIWQPPEIDNKTICI